MTNESTLKMDAATWIGHTVVDTSGDKIGKVADVYVDDATGTPEWLAVKSGLLGTHTNFVPLAGAIPKGDELEVRYEKDQVTSAPSAESDGHLSLDEEAAIYRHYGLDEATGPSAAPGDGGGLAWSTSGQDTDRGMTRSEEELRVGTRATESGRARLRKYIVTEQQQVTVPVRHEEVRVVHETISAENRDPASDGPDLSEEETEMVLQQEEVVVETRAVPKERVRLDKETVTDQETVTADVRKEVVETEGDLAPGRTARS